MIDEEGKIVKCIWCGRINSVQQVDFVVYWCDICQKQFDKGGFDE